MNIADKIYKIVQQMPEDKAIEVLDFAEFLQQKSSSEVQSPTSLKPLPALEGFVPSDWKDAIYEQK